MTKAIRLVLCLGLVVLFACLPFIISESLVFALLLSFLWLVLAANYDILGGYLGYTNLAQGAFFGLGAYTAIGLLQIPAVQALETFAFLLVTPGVILTTGVFALLTAFPMFRLRGLYFAVGTLVLVFLLQVLATNLDTLTGGSYGAFTPPQYLVSNRAAYYLAFLLALMSVGFNVYLSRSTLGLALTCIREDEEAARSIGIGLLQYKIAAFVISSLPSGVAGLLFALNSGFIDPLMALSVERSFFPALMAMLGGTGLPLGPVLGTALIRVVDVGVFHYLALPVPSLVLFGLIFMVMALFIPTGLLNARPVQKGIQWLVERFHC